ncbi:hypothetical protein EV700_2793 [Fluviicoccus keumensis]|uniref:Uncharacterized protein n=1 Tax=Fluviicoccus keumensis TaxID=1435465 RepID=A0A4Q7YNJ5_9GAMM|nr:hypothetical protein [Fluviicoccus keumensis]RZU38215.1 hypothetical protein EV700_2793 [Fluviicoccus keumensis]
MSSTTFQNRPGLMACALIAVSLILTGCGGPLKTPPFNARQQLKAGESTRKDVLRLLGKPEQEADIPRFMLPDEIKGKCLAWSEYRLHALIYKKYDYLNPYMHTTRQETQVYLTPAGKVCASGSWVWENNHEKVWKFTQRPEF